MKDLDKKLIKEILNAQRRELTEHHIYARLARAMKQGNDKEILKRISQDELSHSEFWKGYSKKDVKPDKFTILKYTFISMIFGNTFGLKLMEKGEGDASEKYQEFTSAIPEVKKLIQDEDVHEREILGLLDEDFGITGLSFIIGFVIRKFFNIEI